MSPHPFLHHLPFLLSRQEKKQIIPPLTTLLIPVSLSLCHPRPSVQVMKCTFVILALVAAVQAAALRTRPYHPP
jgi:hypothetical protein